MHGYEMIQELDARTHGAWRPSAGSIYPTLQLLADEGLVRSDDSGDRRRYTLTDAGRAVVEERQGPPPWEEVGGGAGAHGRQLREAGFQMAAAVMHAATTGSDEQVAKVRDILVDARKRIYDVLGEGAGT
jgi:DNA-binding PadR family transcriptional regulator